MNDNSILAFLFFLVLENFLAVIEGKKERIRASKRQKKVKKIYNDMLLPSTYS